MDLDELRRQAEQRPTDGEVRLAYAAARLLEDGHRAAAWHELEAAELLSGVQRLDLRALLTRRVGSDEWVPEPADASVLARIAAPLPDARFPRALVRCRDRLLPLVLTLGSQCSRCAGTGIEVCSTCGGTGIRSLSPQSGNGEDLEFPCDWCDATHRCPHLDCYATGFVSRGAEWWKRSSCSHPSWSEELKASAWSHDDAGVADWLASVAFSRCGRCGLARLGQREACGTCGLFGCGCGPSDAFPLLSPAGEVVWSRTRPKGALRSQVDGRAWKLTRAGSGTALTIEGEEVAVFLAGLWPPSWRAK